MRRRWRSPTRCTEQLHTGTGKSGCCNRKLARPAKRSREMLQVVARTGNQGEPGVSSTLQVPLDAEAGGTLTLQLHFHEAEPTTPSTLPAHEVGPRAEAPASSGSAGLNPHEGGQALTGPVNATVADTAEDPVDAWLEARETAGRGRLGRAGRRLPPVGCRAIDCGRDRAATWPSGPLPSPGAAHGLLRRCPRLSLGSR